MKRANWRTTLFYRWKPRIHFGIEYNPRVGEVRPLLFLIPITETEKRPAVIFNISSDRIGTPEGTSFSLAVSKDIKKQTGLPIAPYVGVVYGTYDHRTRILAGMNITITDKFSALFQFDGVKVHPTFTYTFNKHHSLTFLLIRGYKPSASYSFSF